MTRHTFTVCMCSGTVPGYPSPGLGERPLVHGAGEGLDSSLRYCGLSYEAWLPPGVPGTASQVALTLSREALGPIGPSVFKG